MKKTNLFEKFNKVFYALLIMTAVSFTFTACDSGDDEDDVDPAPENSILEIVAASETHTQLELFLNEYPDLITTLEGNGPFTLFAPNDDAFNALKVVLGVDDLMAVNPAVIKGVLAFHVHTSEVRRSEFDPETTLPTAQGESITFNSETNIETGCSNTNVGFVGEEILATNGVVQVVERILIPPTVCAAIGQNLGKVSQIVLLGADFSTLAAAITKADQGYAAVTEGKTPLSSILADESLSLTVFAPVNQVFAAAEITLDTYTAEQWYGIIANHVLLSKKLTTDLVEAEGNATAAGGAITLLPSGGLDSNGQPGAEATFIEGAVNIEASNGVVHAIGGVLAPAASGRFAIDKNFTLLEGLGK